MMSIELIKNCMVGLEVSDIEKDCEGGIILKFNDGSSCTIKGEGEEPYYFSNTRIIFEDHNFINLINETI